MEARRERWRRGIPRREAPASDWIGILAALGLLMAYGYGLHLWTARTPFSGVPPRLGDQDAVVQHLNKLIKKEAAAKEAEEAQKETALPAIASSSSSTARPTTASEERSTSGVSPPVIPAASPTGIDQTTGKATTTSKDPPSPTPSVLASSSTAGDSTASKTSVGTTPDAQKDEATTVSSTATSTVTLSTDGTSVTVPIPSSSNVATTISGGNSSASTAEPSSSSLSPSADNSPSGVVDTTTQPKTAFCEPGPLQAGCTFLRGAHFDIPKGYKLIKSPLDTEIDVPVTVTPSCSIMFILKRKDGGEDDPITFINDDKRSTKDFTLRLLEYKQVYSSKSTCVTMG